jgi:hypothetical protein
MVWIHCRLVYSSSLHSSRLHSSSLLSSSLLSSSLHSSRLHSSSLLSSSLSLRVCSLRVCARRVCSCRVFTHRISPRRVFTHRISPHRVHSSTSVITPSLVGCCLLIVKPIVENCTFGIFLHHKCLSHDTNKSGKCLDQFYFSPPQIVRFVYPSLSRRNMVRRDLPHSLSLFQPGFDVLAFCVGHLAQSQSPNAPLSPPQPSDGVMLSLTSLIPQSLASFCVL